MNSFGTYLRALREQHGLSRPKVRDLIRDRYGDDQAISASTIENWENGKIGEPSAAALGRLVTVLGGDLNEAFNLLIADTRPDEQADPAQHAERASDAPRGGASRRANHGGSGSRPARQ